jgi:hypothetical protein
VRRRKKRKQQPNAPLSHLHCNNHHCIHQIFNKEKGKKNRRKKLAMHRPEKKVNYLVHLGKYRPHDGDEISLVSEVNKPKDPLKLLKTNNSGCSTHEAHYRRM